MSENGGKPKYIYVPVALEEEEALQLLGAARAVFESASMMGQVGKAAPLARAMVKLAEATDKAREKARA